MTGTDKIVQLLRVAKTLGEQACGLSQAGELGPEALSHRLGELRQIYPQLWSLLDDARAQLAALGRDVSHYDALRARPAASAGGVLDVRLGDRGPDSKSAAVNAEGCHLALEAVYALRALLPEIDWMGIEDAEAAEIAKVGSLGPAPWKGVVLGLILFGTLGAVIAIVIYLQITS